MSLAFVPKNTHIEESSWLSNMSHNDPIMDKWVNLTPQCGYILEQKLDSSNESNWTQFFPSERFTGSIE